MTSVKFKLVIEVDNAEVFNEELGSEFQPGLRIALFGGHAEPFEPLKNVLRDSDTADQPHRKIKLMLGVTLLGCLPEAFDCLAQVVDGPCIVT